MRTTFVLVRANFANNFATGCGAHKVTCHAHLEFAIFMVLPFLRIDPPTIIFLGTYFKKIIFLVQHINKSRKDWEYKF